MAWNHLAAVPAFWAGSTLRSTATTGLFSGSEAM